MEEVLESQRVAAAAAQFGPFGGRVWLNTAHQGPLPGPAVAAAGHAAALVVLARPDGTAAQRRRQLTEAGVDAAYREGNLRLSVHLFNTAAHVERALEALHSPRPDLDKPFRHPLGRQ